MMPRRRRGKNQIARAGKKEGGWGEGIFARPRFSAAEFRASETGAPLTIFLARFYQNVYLQPFGLVLLPHL